ncbi:MULTISPECIES: terminase small subunit [Gammaproteobacteria]|uniref:terminase small subunit n=1 Tax=Gammaproteobacteria TaxID=1236 RepID=UPI002FCC2A29
MQDEENYKGSTQDKIRKTGNFKALYNKKYGDIANLNHKHKFTPEQLFDFAVRYFSWAEDNAIKAAETANFQGVVSEHLVHKFRVFTLNGLCLFAGFSSSGYSKWRKEPGFSDVTEWIDGVITEQKFQLAANGLINASFIGKDLGIDKASSVEVNLTANQEINNVKPDEEFKTALMDVLGNL